MRPQRTREKSLDDDGDGGEAGWLVEIGEVELVEKRRAGSPGWNLV